MATDISFLEGSFRRPLHTSPNSPVSKCKQKIFEFLARDHDRLTGSEIYTFSLHCGFLLFWNIAHSPAVQFWNLPEIFFFLEIQYVFYAPNVMSDLYLRG